MIDTTSLTTKLYQSLSDDEAPRKMEYWHASSIAQCLRAQFYARAGIPRLSKPTGAKVLRWQAGHLIEEVIRPHLKKQLPNLVSNVRFTNAELDLTGEIDNYDPDSKSLIEIKSVSSHAVKYRKVSDTRPHLRDERQYLNHEYQQAAYVELMKYRPDTFITIREPWYDHTIKENTLPMTEEWSVEQIIYLYITLDGLLVLYSTLVNEEVLSNVTKRLELLQASWKAQTPPPCLCVQEDHPLYKSTMQYCDYKNGNECCSDQLWRSFNEQNSNRPMH